MANPIRAPTSGIDAQQKTCYEGENLARLLKSIQREMASARLSDSALPEKVWIKQQFAIGVNEVTRVLERMAACSKSETLPQGNTSSFRLQPAMADKTFAKFGLYKEGTSYICQG